MTDPPGIVRPLELPASPRILVIRFSALGDVLLTFPAVRALRERYPGAHIAFLTDSRMVELLEGLPAIDRVLAVDRLALRRLAPGAIRRLVEGLVGPLRRERWDAVIDLQGFGETAWLTRWTGAPVRVGRRGRRRQPWAYRPFIDVPFPDRYMAWVHLDTLARAGLIAESEPRFPYYEVSAGMQAEWASRRAALERTDGERVGLFVGAAYAEKIWPAERFGELAAALATESPRRQVLVFGGPHDEARVERVVRTAAATGADRVVAAGSGRIGALAAAWKDCRVVISNDTGPMHLSVAVGTPTVAIIPHPLPHFIPPPPHRTVHADRGSIDAVTVSRVLAATRELMNGQGVATSSRRDSRSSATSRSTTRP